MFFLIPYTAVQLKSLRIAIVAPPTIKIKSMPAAVIHLFTIVPKIALMLVAPNRVKRIGPPQQTRGRRAKTPIAASMDLEPFSSIFMLLSFVQDFINFIKLFLELPPSRKLHITPLITLR